MTPRHFSSIHNTHHSYDYSDSYDEFSLLGNLLRSNTRIRSKNNRPLRFKDLLHEIVIGNRM